MKNIYASPEITVIYDADIIATSGGKGSGSDSSDDGSITLPPIRFDKW